MFPEAGMTHPFLRHNLLRCCRHWNFVKTLQGENMVTLQWNTLVTKKLHSQLPIWSFITSDFSALWLLVSNMSYKALSRNCSLWLWWCIPPSPRPHYCQYVAPNTHLYIFVLHISCLGKVSWLEQPVKYFPPSEHVNSTALPWGQSKCTCERHCHNHILTYYETLFGILLIAVTMY